jgi:hypothetical protein
MNKTVFSNNLRLPMVALRPAMLRLPVVAVAVAVAAVATVIRCKIKRKPFLVQGLKHWKELAVRLEVKHRNINNKLFDQIDS